MNTRLELLHINPDAIIVSERLRYVDEASVKDVTESIEQVG